MTEPDRALDPSILFKSEASKLYRLARARYANLSGVGAAQAPGRWNKLGQEALYTSTEVGVPLLERLVHTPKDLIPNNLALLTIELHGSWEVRVTSTDSFGTASDRKTGGRMLIFQTIAKAKLYFDFASGWADAENNPLAVAVPSVVVPAWNVVLLPAGTAFWKHVRLISVEPFVMDERLFPKGTVRES